MTATYTVREPGCSAWSGPGLTRAQAEHDLQGARRAGLQRAEIVEDDDEPDRHYHLQQTTIWAIENGQTGVLLGLYEASDQQQAIAAMMADAGHSPDTEADPDLVVSDALLALRTAETAEGLAGFVDDIIDRSGYRTGIPWGALAGHVADADGYQALSAFLRAAKVQLQQIEEGGAS